MSTGDSANPGELNSSFAGSDRLSRIPTMADIFANFGEAVDAPDAVAAAQQRLLDRYYDPVLRYARRIVGDHDRAEDLAQEFCLRVMKRAFRGFDPRRGRFRLYVKEVVRNLAHDYQRKAAREDQQTAAIEPQELAAPLDDVPGDGGSGGSDLLDSLLETVFQRLDAEKQQSPPSEYDVLLYSFHHPEHDSDDMAEALTAELKLAAPLKAATVRKKLQRARERFADLVVDEVAHAAPGGTEARIEDRLAELGLLDVCRKALAKRRAGGWTSFLGGFWGGK